MKIVIASDHGGVDLKKYLVDNLGLTDLGPADKTSCDYPDYAKKVAQAVASGEADFGVLICRSGIGMCMCANRYKGVRAALCYDMHYVPITRQHNGANVLCLGADVVKPELALEMVKTFVATEVDPDARHERRRQKIDSLVS